METWLDWIPPLPVVGEILDLRNFVAHSFDDFCEDLVKWIALTMLFWLACGVLATCGVSRKGPARGAALLCSTVLAFPHIDAMGDAVGNMVQPHQDEMAKWLGLDPAPKPDPGDRKHTKGVVDDYVEDVFKIVCVWSHFHLGSALSDIIIPDALLNSPHWAARAAGGSASWIVALASPAGYYQACDEYGDRLGDAVERAVPRALILFRSAEPTAIAAMVLWTLGFLLMLVGEGAVRKIGECIVFAVSVPLLSMLASSKLVSEFVW